MSKDFPERKLNRLKTYNYSMPGSYFITICTKGHEELFGNIKNKKMYLSEYGKIAQQYWKNIPNHFENIEMDEFIVMPDHIHGIITIPVDTCRERRSAFPTGIGSSDRTKMMVSKIIHGFKSSVTRKIRAEYNDYTFKWQKSFHDRIIRNDEELYKIRKYILDNPQKLFES